MSAPAAPSSGPEGFGEPQGGAPIDVSVWDLVVGHDEQVAALREAIATGRVTHAWLFTGPPGIGKLHTARVFAAALNCPAGGDGTCDSCRRILRGVHPDVHLIVPEGDFLLVEEVRAVREEAYRSRHEARTAVFLFDEADRMTEAAANALLKVLEEPPANVVFVLVARSAEALVGTVPSRARTVAFVSLSLAELTDALAAELDLSPGQTAWAAAASRGRLARARALLTDEATRGRRSSVLDLLGRLGSDQASEALAAAGIVAALADEVVAAARVRQERELAELEEAFGSGRGTGALRRRLEVRHRRELRRARFDAIREALADLLAAYRDIALLGIPGAEAGPAGAPLVHPDKAATTERLAAAIDPAAAVRAAGALEEADRRLTIGAAPQLTLEAAFLSVQAALRGPAVPIRRMAIRR
jgi:DNA polymerase III subunit delta'